MIFSEERKRKVSPPPFPEHLILPMFLDGLRRGRPIASAAGVSSRDLNGLYDLCGMLHFLPMFFAGARASERIHTFVSDVSYDFAYGTGANVLIYHPQYGAPGESGFKNREDYLHLKYGLQPRNKVIGQQQAGFKGLHLNETDSNGWAHTRLYWVVPEIGHLYWHIFRAFVNHVRPISAKHPYLLTSLANRAYGTPWTLDAAISRFQRSLRNIGLEQSSKAGLCMHACRHATKRHLDVMGVPPEMRQIVLHHRTIEAQDDYAKPTLSEMRTALTPSCMHEEVSTRESRTMQLNEIGRELTAFFGVVIQ